MANSGGKNTMSKLLSGTIIATCCALMAACSESDSVSQQSGAAASGNELVLVAVEQALLGSSEGLAELISPGFENLSGLNTGAPGYLWAYKSLNDLCREIQVQNSNIVSTESALIVKHEFVATCAEFGGLGPAETSEFVLEQEFGFSEENTLANVKTDFSRNGESVLPSLGVAPTKPIRPPGSVLSSFDKGAFIEGLAVDKGGTVYVSLILDNNIWRIEKDGSKSIFATLPFDSNRQIMQGIFCLDIDAEGNFFVSVNSPDESIRGIWKLSPDAQPVLWAQVPGPAVLNGIDVDEDGNVFVADTLSGTIWHVDSTHSAGQMAQVWVSHPILNPTPFVNVWPGINGVRRSNTGVSASVSDTGLVVDFDWNTKAPRIVTKGAGVDDFIIDNRGRYVLTTHPYNSIEIYDPQVDDRYSLFTEQEGVWGPAAVGSFALSESKALYYVGTDGGLFGRGFANAFQAQVFKFEY